MLWTNDLNGEVKCVEDNASCVLDGENARRGIQVEGTGSGTLVLRAITFKDGEADSGGGVDIYNGAIVDIELCVFTNCRATGTIEYGAGGGGIFVYTYQSTVNIYGTHFTGNTANSGNGDDIYRELGLAVTIHDTCPSPYSSNTPIQGKTN
jgi:hypothetical protein